MQKRFAKSNISANPTINKGELYVGDEVIKLPYGFEWIVIESVDSTDKIYLAKDRRGHLVNPHGLIKNVKPSMEIAEFFRGQSVTFDGMSVVYKMLAEVHDVEDS